MRRSLLSTPTALPTLLDALTISAGKDAHLEELYTTYSLFPADSAIVENIEEIISGLKIIDLTKLCVRLLALEAKQHGEKLLRERSLATLGLKVLLRNCNHADLLADTFKQCKQPEDFLTRDLMLAPALKDVFKSMLTLPALVNMPETQKADIMTAIIFTSFIETPYFDLQSEAYHQLRTNIYTHISIDDPNSLHFNIIKHSKEFWKIPLIGQFSDKSIAKRRVLIAALDYLHQMINLEELEAAKLFNPLWNKSSGKSKTQLYVEAAIATKLSARLPAILETTELTDAAALALPESSSESSDEEVQVEDGLMVDYHQNETADHYFFVRVANSIVSTGLSWVTAPFSSLRAIASIYTDMLSVNEEFSPELCSTTTMQRAFASSLATPVSISENSEQATPSIIESSKDQASKIKHKPAKEIEFPGIFPMEEEPTQPTLTNYSI